MMEHVAKLGVWSVKHMTGARQDGSNYDFYSLTKSVFNKEKNAWESKDIALSAADLAIAAAVCAEAVRKTACEEALKSNQRMEDRRQGDASEDGVPF